MGDMEGMHLVPRGAATAGCDALTHLYLRAPLPTTCDPEKAALIAGLLLMLLPRTFTLWRGVAQ
jgi:hypothetical protein